MPGEVEFEVLETYVLNGQKRYRLKIKNTNIIVNVAAETPEEAGEKAIRLLEKSKVLETIKNQ